MTRSIVYLGGAARESLDQSAAMVVDRIARAIRSGRGPGQRFIYRIREEKDAHWLASNIGIDVAVIETPNGNGGWEPALELLEIKYLPRLTRDFARLPGWRRGLRALGLIWDSVRRARRWRQSAGGGQAAFRLPRLDRAQALVQSIVSLDIMLALLGWLAIGTLVAWGLGQAKLEAPLLAAIVAVLATGARTLPQNKSRDQSAVESFSFLDYQMNGEAFLSIPNAVLDTIVLAKQRGCQTVDLLGFSLGSVLAVDTLFARRPLAAEALPIDNLITIGFPYDLIRSATPDYFENRLPPTLTARHWINVVVKDDFLATPFRPGDGRAIVLADGTARTPDVSLSAPCDDARWKQPNPVWDWLSPRRLINHHIYWNDEDPWAPTCFHEVAGRAGWL